MATTKQEQQNPPLFTRLQTFYQEVRNEMSKVAWPSKDEIKANTSVVLAILAIIALIVGVMDIVFRTVIMTLLSLA